MKNTREISNLLGQMAIANAVGVGRTAVNNAVNGGRGFPAAWFPIVRDMLKEHGEDCPECAFNFRVSRDAGIKMDDRDGS